MCPTGMTNCGGECVDLQVDPTHCGSCGNRCPGPSSNSGRRQVGGGPVCQGGECSYVCFPGFANCDKDDDNGCEANLKTDPSHCGNCDTTCNLSADQPCVVGKCLTRDCDAGVLH